MPNEYIDGYMEVFTEYAGLVAKNHEQKIFSKVNGEENFKQLMAWADENLEKEEVDKYNQALMDPEQTDMALDALILKSSDALNLAGTKPATD